ncbi:hypothetical protein [Kitasatospora sp. LaBMicrA B282]|uniref:hypothetical protein n=1 Tax=Kitasatospora sp. LaBMicrA B282 TaxID=3420949 RepID=UPI003D0E54CF
MAAELLLLPLPELLPTDRPGLTAAAGTLGGHDLEPVGLSSTASELATCRRAAQVVLSAGITRTISTPKGWSAEEQALDVLFDVGRAEGDSATILAGALGTAYVDVIEDATSTRTTLSPQDWRDLTDGMGQALALIGLTGTEVAPPATADRLPDIRRLPACHERLRWMLGHRLFYTLTQALIVSLSLFTTATSRGDHEAAEQALTTATALMRASAAALLYTADFPHAVYADDIRPNVMRPPNTLPGISGIQGRDHHVLIQLFRDLRPVFGALSGTSESYQRFRAATERLFANHTHICDKFVGPVKPSLLMEARSRSKDQISARLALRKLTRRRLRLLEGRADY